MAVSEDNDQTNQLQERIARASTDNQPLNIRGGGSKDFFGMPSEATELDVSQHSGIISYEPTELVITARSGTTLESLNKALAENGQMLPFEPPVFTPKATLGGTTACGLSGPSRPYKGAIRDYVLGCRVINGKAQTLRFGGEVMKNVAGYDVTRLMTGAMGTLGVLLDTSLKVLPRPEHELTLVHQTNVSSAIEKMQALAGNSIPVTASAYLGGKMMTRLSGAQNAVTATAKTLGGELAPDNSFWSHLRDHQLDFFNSDLPLWRISVPALTPELDLAGDCLYDWAGMQRWIFSNDDAQKIRSTVENVGGHAQLFKADDAIKKQAGVFHPPQPAIMQLHKKIKHEFDPQGLFNPQRMYSDI